MPLKYRLGKAPAQPRADTFKFSTFFNPEALPVPPLRYGHERIGAEWGLFANDQYGDCVFAGAAHEHMIYGHEGSNAPPAFTDANVLSDYAAVTGFVPTDPNSDQGTDMTAAASYRRKTGIVDAAGRRHTIDAYVALRPGDRS